MYQVRKNYIRPLSRYYTHLDEGIFRKYLHIPSVYLKGIVRRYPRNLSEVPPVLHELIEQCDKFYWERYRMSTKKSNEELVKATMYKIARVPPMLLDRNEFPATSGANLKVYSQILDNPAGFSKLGRVLYFHSEFEENAMLAVANIIKRGIDAKLTCAMLPLSTFMDEVKTFEKSKILDKLDESDIAGLTMLGTVYKAQSGFTEATLTAFVDKRRVSGKSTVLSSHLSPAEFRDRYGIELGRFGAVCMKFDDKGVVATVAQLAKELEALGGK